MCDVCRVEGIQSEDVNGQKAGQNTYILYAIVKNTAVKVKLCYYHSIDLFRWGERVFLKRYPDLGHYLKDKDLFTNNRAA
jgi:hypothetical protein